MSYKFLNTAIVAYLTARHRAEIHAYCERAVFVLSEEVCGYNFQETGSDGRVHVAMFEHSFGDKNAYLSFHRTCAKNSAGRRIQT